MPWFRVDDAFHSHPKAMSATPAALGLWVIAGSWAAGNPDNGFVPLYVLRRLLPDWELLAEELVSLKLWTRAKGGYRFRDWDHYQLSKEEVERDRANARERQRKARRKMRGMDLEKESPEGSSALSKKLRAVGGEDR